MEPKEVLDKTVPSEQLATVTVNKKWWNHWYVAAASMVIIVGATILVTTLVLNKKSTAKSSSEATVANSSQANASSTSMQEKSNPVTAVLKDGPDKTKLPLGDGKMSTEPKQGYLYSCQAQGGGGGAQSNGEWLGTSTWDLTKKPHVSGDVAWPSAKITLGTSGSSRTIVSNDLPTIHDTGIFPISINDPVHKYDANPNTIKAQSYTYQISLTPKLNAKGSCLPGGPIGIMLDGVILFNGFDAENRDAVAHEIQDSCGGHPERSGLYHYHGISTCIPNATTNKLIGYSFDGFGIYGNKDSAGNTLSTADLDACHGITSNVEWDGKTVSLYHYVVTNDFPYTLGCYMGTSTSSKTPPKP